MAGRNDYRHDDVNPKCVCDHRLNLHRESDGKCVGTYGVAYTQHCNCVRFVQVAQADEPKPLVAGRGRVKNKPLGGKA